MKQLQLGSITAIHGDCMEYMKSLPDKAYDLAIVDPPYGIDVANMNMGAGKSKKASNIKNRKWERKDWDSTSPTKEYFDELFRVSKTQMIWGGNYFDLPACGHFIVWDKQIADGLSFSDCEYCWTSLKRANRIFRYSVYLDKKGKMHPTQKPVQLYKQLLQNYAKQGDKILDTHGGSFSHAIACHDLGFELTIIEIDEQYFNDATERLKLHQRQLQLF